MPATALALALTAAFVHALWNVLIARARDIESTTAVALVVAEIVFAPVAFFTWDAERAVWPFLAVTGLLQLVYFVLLATAYRLVPLSVVYPVARGGAPVLVLVGGAGHGHCGIFRRGLTRAPLRSPLGGPPGADRPGRRYRLGRSQRPGGAEGPIRAR